MTFLSVTSIVIQSNNTAEMKFQSENEIFEIVRAFENGTISRSRWRHAEHLTVALYYVLHTPTLSNALDKMRFGIFKLLKSFEIDLSVEMPHHETLTVFWLRTVSNFVKSKNDSSIVGICNELIETFDKDYPLKFYSRELLFSEKSRKILVQADLRNDNGKLLFDYKSVSHQN
ncbi:MAG TPA: hypothetical protein VNI84_03275 [Pyrinomonadaceae bacterium]|nr:hypothetical protein [Pyrinomonadaceae bacterium]